MTPRPSAAVASRASRSGVAPLAARADVFALSNGLRVAIAPGPHLHRAAVSCVVEVGARYEDAATMGLSHFLEHMLHRGTPSFPSAHALAAGVEGLGGSMEAATGVDRGTLSVTTPPESVLDVVHILGEVMTSPLFLDLEVERGIVREELLEDRDERGRLIDPDGVVRSMLFGDHPLGYPIVGTPATLRRFNVPLVGAHHARHYTARSAVVVLAGRLGASRDRIAKAAERAFGKVARGKRVPARRFVRDSSDSPSAKSPANGPLSITRTSSSQVSLRVGCLGPGRKDRRAHAAELLLRLIDDGNATRLYETLCDRRGLCYEVSAGYEAYDEAGLFDVAAEAHEGAITEVLREILSMLRTLATDGPTQVEVDRALKRARWHAARSLDQPETLAEQIGLGVLAGEPLGLFERVEKMSAFGPRQVRDLARAMFGRDRLAVAVIGDVSRSTERELGEILRTYAPRK